ncbi:uncharacterized protein TrAtP1_006077 [Trichoderma atroviride]|uniref:uncharacterized protein n=1 Tax=Hypocrea atroviridis TaxID=63577 RepID=UPI00332775C4|nr:hypothetical protein TrAtP1_006077 [Trichoderma atroviride]
MGGSDLQNRDNPKDLKFVNRLNTLLYELRAQSRPSNEDKQHPESPLIAHRTKATRKAPVWVKGETFPEPRVQKSFPGRPPTKFKQPSQAAYPFSIIRQGNGTACPSNLGRVWASIYTKSFS